MTWLHFRSRVDNLCGYRLHCGSCQLTHMTIGDAIQLAEASRPPDGVVRCLIYVRISMDKAHDGHGVANQMANPRIHGDAGPLA
jgi:hypothetical protein